MIEYKNKTKIIKYELNGEIQKLNEKIDGIENGNVINSSMISEVEQDISRIDREIKDINKKNIKTACIRNIKIFGKTLKIMVPYILVASLVFILQVKIYDVPFIRQKSIKITKHEETIENGIIHDETSYFQRRDEENSAIYKTGWVQKEDGKYYQATKEYYIDNYSFEELIQMMNDPDFNVDKVFKQKGQTKYDIKKSSEITDVDLKETEGFKIVYHYDDTDVILEAQGVGQNVLYSIFYLLFTIIACFVTKVVYLEVDEGIVESIKNNIYLIKKNNKKVDIDELKRLFKENKIKFNIIRHQQVALVDPETHEKLIIKTKKLSNN